MHEEPFLIEGRGKPKPKAITGHRTSYKPIKIQTNYTQLSIGLIPLRHVV